MRSWLSALIALAAAAFLVYAASLNQTRVERVDWVLGSAVGVPLWTALAASALCGGLLVALLLAVPALRLRFRLRRAQRRIAQLEHEVHGLRTLPLEDEVRGAGRGV